MTDAVVNLDSLNWRKNIDALSAEQQDIKIIVLHSCARNRAHISSNGRDGN
jgi:hypothetical protein